MGNLSDFQKWQNTVLLQQKWQQTSKFTLKTLFPQKPTTENTHEIATIAKTLITDTNYKLQKN